MITHRSDTILGKLHDGWSKALLCDLLSEDRGGDWGDDDGPISVKVLRSTNFTDRGLLNFQDVAERHFSELKASTLNLQKNDLLLERSGGGPTQPVGRIGFVTQDLPGYWFSNFVQLLRPNAENINPEYLGWVLLEINRSGVIERLQHQTTQMRNLDFRDYLRVYIPKPSPAEQAAIAEILSLVNIVISEAEAQLTAAKRVKTAIMQQLFTRGLPGRHVKFKNTKIGEIPEDWEIIKLKQTGPIISGGTPDRNNKSYFGGDILWVKSGEVDYCVIEDTEEKITPEGAESINGELLPKGTVLVAMYGAGITRGKSAILGKPAYINQAIASFKCDEHTDNRWLFYWFERNYERVRALAGGANQDNLNLYLLKNFWAARPLLDEQIEIGCLLYSADELIISIKSEIKKLDRLKNSLLQNLLTGIIRLKQE